MDDAPVKFILLVPLCYNDGTEVPNTVILDFQEQLFALGGGFTIAGTVEGAYRMKESIYLERTGSSLGLIPPKPTSGGEL